MPTHDQMMSAVNAFATFGEKQAAAHSLNLARSTFRHHLKAAMSAGLTPATHVPIAAPLPPKDMPIEDLVAHRERAFEIRHAHNQAKVWRKFKVPTAGPYALMFFGDPHLDDDGCNLPLFKAHANLAAETYRESPC